MWYTIVSSIAGFMLGVIFHRYLSLLRERRSLRRWHSEHREMGRISRRRDVDDIENAIGDKGTQDDDTWTGDGGAKLPPQK